MADPYTYWLRQDGRLWIHKDRTYVFSDWVRLLRGPQVLLQYLQNDFSGGSGWAHRMAFDESSPGFYDVDGLLDLDRQVLYLDPHFLLADHTIEEGFSRAFGEWRYLQEALSSSPVWMKAVEELLISTGRWTGWSIAFLKRCVFLDTSEIMRFHERAPELIYRLDDLPGDNPAEQILVTHSQLRRLILSLPPSFHKGLEEVQETLKQARPRRPLL